MKGNPTDEGQTGAPLAKSTVAEQRLAFAVAVPLNDRSERKFLANFGNVCPMRHELKLRAPVAERARLNADDDHTSRRWERVVAVARNLFGHRTILGIGRL